MGKENEKKPSEVLSTEEELKKISGEMLAFCGVFGLDKSLMLTKGRNKDYVMYRALMMERLYRTGRFTEAQVSGCVNREHATLIHAKDKIIPTVLTCKHDFYDKWKQWYKIFNAKFETI